MVYEVSYDTILFYSCILVLFLRTKQHLVTILMRFISDMFHLDDHQNVMLDLPVIQFGDLQDQRGRHRTFDLTCFLCLKEYEKDDVVSQLSRCGHVYHTRCLGKMMMDDCELSCPFCKSSIFKAMPSNYLL